MKPVFDWLGDPKHPMRTAWASLVVGLVNLYEAVYVRPDSHMSFVDWAFAVGSSDSCSSC
jgi:hypothetical protein